MARGKGKESSVGWGGTMPRFIDVKLTPEQRKEFSGMVSKDSELVGFLARITFDGYRVGCSWSGEHQSFTISLTCRDEKNPNNGLCMTSFAGELAKAVALAQYKFEVVAGEVWAEGQGAVQESFG